MARRFLRQANSCPKIYRPVCGADRLPYTNDCLAADAGTRVACLGACPCAQEEERVLVAAGGGAGVPGPVPVSEPAVPADGAGSAPVACPAIYRPVCSTAGVVRPNGCAARAAGEAVECQGTCPCPGAHASQPAAAAAGALPGPRHAFSQPGGLGDCGLIVDHSAASLLKCPSCCMHADLLAALAGGGGVLLVPSDAALLSALDAANTTVDAWLGDAAALRQALAHHAILQPGPHFSPYANGSATTEAGDAVSFQASPDGQPLSVTGREAGGSGDARSEPLAPGSVSQGCGLFAVVTDVLIDQDLGLEAGLD